MPTFRQVFAEAAGPGGTLPFDRFSELALYHPEVGYYRSAKPRVGRSSGTDFYTSTNSNPVFGELVAAACATLVGTERAADFSFVEIGAEPGADILEGLKHPFRDYHATRIGEPLQIEGPCVVFSNELFDAQPFLRLVFRDGAWREIGVRSNGDRFEPSEMPAPGAEAERLIARLPADPGEGYQFDLSARAAGLAAAIAARRWHGLFVACDYGKSWRELTEECPAGTARAYRSHKQHNDLLADPGEQDLTCHVCWDEITAALASNGFEHAMLESQEAFFLHHARPAIEAIVTGAPRGPDLRRLQLQQLIHPALQGQKFQVLTARRGPGTAAGA